uniref:Uncharacterized protein n=1 Tax=Heliothis virescens TaxID=7102 RepID=A0A2A4K0W8_HELVI
MITLAIGLAASDKLDRTYLPPPGAQFSGGILGSHDAPFEPPHHLQPGLETAVTDGQLVPQTNGINGEPVNFGDKIPKVPINYIADKFPTTTTSYAFSQTTTYPPAEGFETTPLPINPVTGLPIQLEQGNFPFGPQGQQNIQNLPSYTNQGPTYGPAVQPTFISGTNNQPISQHPGQSIITPGPVDQVPGKENQNAGLYQGQVQYPGQGNSEQQENLYSGAPDNSLGLNQYTGQNVVYPGGLVNIPGATQGLVQYPTQQTLTSQPGFPSTTAAPTNSQTVGNQYGTIVNPDGSQGTYSGQPINVQNLGETRTTHTQSPFQNQELLNIGSNPAQYPINSQNYDVSGSTPSTIPSNYYNGISSTTSLPELPSSTSAYPVPRVYRPERPQAAADRNAVILNYENVRTPNGYSYSFDTSNGIHADENGIVDNGTKAQGSYSYIGDDGKEYSVIYTADENGFQPRGDHLPTPSPIPEAIQKVIEQAAKDKLAGIFDDGSYDEAKYGDNKYQGPTNRLRPQNQQHKGRFNNKLNKGGKKGIVAINPIAGIIDEEYDEVIPENQLNNNALITDTRKNSNGKLPTSVTNDGSSNRGTSKNNIQVTEPTKTILGEGDVLLGSVDDYGKPGSKQFDNYGITKQGSTSRPLLSNGNVVPVGANKNPDQNNVVGMKNREDFTNTKYPGSHVDVNGKPLPGGLGDDDRQGTDSNKPGFFDGQTKHSKYISSTSAPIVTDTNQIIRQKINDNKTPDSERIEYSQNRNNIPKTEKITQVNKETPSISDYINNADNEPVRNQQQTQQDENGYYYQQPNTKFEQNTFPTRFNPQEISSTRQPDQGKNEYVQGTTRRPFITPNVYDKNENIVNKSPQSNLQSTSRRPFMTIRVTSPASNSYTDYDDGQDYPSDQDIGDDRIYSDKKLPQKIGTTSRPSIYQQTQTTSRPQYTPGNQRNLVNQKGYVTPGQKTEYSGTVTPGYFYESTTPKLAHNSRFGTTQSPRRMKPQQSGPLTKVIETTTGTVRPVTPQSSPERKPSGYEYRTSNVGSGYPTTSTPGYNFVSTTPGVSSPQSYYSSTFRPSQDYTSTSVLPPKSEFYNYNNGQSTSLKPAKENDSFNTGYYYGPPKSDRSQIAGVAPTQSNRNYQTSYQQGPAGFPSTTTASPISGSQGTFIPSQPGTIATKSSPYGPYQGQYQNSPSTPGYFTDIITSTPENKSVFQYPGSGVSNPQGTAPEYGPTRESYPTSGSPSISSTTPGSFVPSRTGPVQDYSTTNRPGFQTTKDTFVGGPTVDGFGRPITTDQGSSYPGFSQVTQGTSTIRPDFGGTGSTSYPETYVKSKVIGEDFSGPKQQQRFDPKTGYYY